MLQRYSRTILRLSLAVGAALVLAACEADGGAPEGEPSAPPAAEPAVGREPLPAVDAEPARANPSPGGEECHPSYPDFCIPPPPPDLDCGDIQGPKPFRVLRPDPHRFDRDGDGRACEPSNRRRSGSSS